MIPMNSFAQAAKPYLGIAIDQTIATASSIGGVMAGFGVVVLIVGGIETAKKALQDLLSNAPMPSEGKRARLQRRVQRYQRQLHEMEAIRVRPDGKSGDGQTQPAPAPAL